MLGVDSIVGWDGCMEEKRRVRENRNIRSLVGMAGTAHIGSKFANLETGGWDVIVWVYIVYGLPRVIYVSSLVWLL